MKTRVIVAVFMLVCGIHEAYAQQKQSTRSNQIKKDTTQSLIAHWKKGETKTYSITHTKISSESGKPTNVTLTYWATAKVTDSTSDGYTVKWNYILPPSGLNVPHANEIYEFFKGLNIFFKTSTTGQFEGVDNWQELKDHYVKMLELTIPPKNDGKVDSALEKVKQMFNSRQMVEGTMAKEIMLLLQAHGNSFSTKESITDASLPNPFIPVKPIPAVLSTKITEIKPQLDYFKIRISQSIDKDGALGLFESVFDKMDLPKDSVIAKAKEMLSNFEINDNCEIKAMLSSGWVTSLLYTRTVNSEMITQKDSYFIEEKNTTN